MAEIIERLADAGTVSPMMQQYVDTKNKFADCILMYRLGDFFEMFFDDAVTVSRALELTLTARDCGDGRRAAMCGVPFHKLEYYVGRLVELGFRVAVCDQVEDPAQAKGLVRREIVRIVTPGTVTDREILREGQNNYLAALCKDGSGYGMAVTDISTGQMYVIVFEHDTPVIRLENEFGIYAPRELILNVPGADCAELCGFLRDRFSTLIDDGKVDLFDMSAAEARVSSCFSGALSDVGPCAVRAAGALLGYIEQTQLCEPSFIRDLRVYGEGQFMEMDLNTRRNLELLESMRSKERRGSLVWVLDRTRTSMGARMLRSHIARPLRNPAQIYARQEIVQAFYDDYMLRSELREQLSHILDIERLTAKAVYGTANAKDLSAICHSIEPLPAIRRLLTEAAQSSRLHPFAERLDVLEDLCELLSSALADELPNTVREGGMIRTGFSEDVDRLRSVGRDGAEWIEKIEAQEREATGIRNLRVGYNKVFGYYIEVSKSNIDSVPDRYIRKQTLANCERYITEELKNMEATILGASDRLCALEYSIFCSLRAAVVDAASRLQQSATVLSELDVYQSFAEVAVSQRYVRPEITSDTALRIVEGRHPVVEQVVSDSYFVPNDTKLDTAHERTMLITGPNMAGKSTYMRQVALIVLMAQIGSFVPAKSATIGIVDRLFTRVGASDDLASGQSTFMLEMNEVAAILRNATSRSLIIYDEVGRGTSTYDGMSIARAVVEYTNNKIKAKTLFATHYHELTALEGEFDGIVNYNIAAKKKGDQLIFLRRIVPGAADDSYGIEVAHLAGVPNEVVRRARQILAELEKSAPASGAPAHASRQADAPPDLFTAFGEEEAGQIAKELRALDIDTLTPIEAMNRIYGWKRRLSAEK